jgi:signal peptidase I
MDLDFPLILVSLVFVGFIILIIDLIAFAPKRRNVIQSLQAKFPQWQTAGSEDAAQYAAAVHASAKESYAVETTKSFLPVLVVVLVLRSFLFEPFQIPSSSMVPTLEVGDFILVNKFAYGIRLPVVRTKVIDVSEPKRGDVMVFFPPNDSRYFIKRVIGLPGDQIQYINKTLYINGNKMSQELSAKLPVGNPSFELANEEFEFGIHQIRKEYFRSGPDPVSITVKPGHYFMMGDNRDNSSDSRVWGQVPEANIVGKAFATWMYWPDKFGLPSFKRVGTIQ